MGRSTACWSPAGSAGNGSGSTRRRSGWLIPACWSPARVMCGRFAAGLRSRGVGERSGIGLVELSMLEALDSLGARSDRRPRRSVRVLQAVDTQIGLAPGYAYQLLVDLAQPWTLAADVRDASNRGNYRFVCVPEPGTRPGEF